MYLTKKSELVRGGSYYHFYAHYLSASKHKFDANFENEVLGARLTIDLGINLTQRKQNYANTYQEYQRIH